MSRNVLADAARESLSIWAWQMGWIAAIALGCAAAFDANVAVSVLAGGAIGSIWTIYMAVALYRHSLSFGARMSALSFVVAWAIKLALTISLLVIAFRSGLFAPLGLLGGLFGAMVAYWGWMAFRVGHANSADGK